MTRYHHIPVARVTANTAGRWRLWLHGTGVRDVDVAYLDPAQLGDVSTAGVLLAAERVMATYGIAAPRWVRLHDLDDFLGYTP